MLLHGYGRNIKREGTFCLHAHIHKPVYTNVLIVAELDTAYQAYFPELCYLYGKKLQQKMGYPIGLVAMTFSDSIIEEWAPHHTLRDCGIAPRDRYI